MVIDRLGFGGLPREVSRHRVRIPVHLIRQAEGAAGNAPEVVTGPERRRRQQQDEGQDDSTERRPKRRPTLSQQPDQQHDPNGQAEHEALVRAAVGQDCKPEPHQQGVADAPVLPDPRQRPQHQRATDGRHRASVVAVAPVVEKGEAHDGQRAAQQGPTWRQPSAVHWLRQPLHRPWEAHRPKFAEC